MALHRSGPAPANSPTPVRRLPFGTPEPTPLVLTDAQPLWMARPGSTHIEAFDPMPLAAAASTSGHTAPPLLAASSPVPVAQIAPLAVAIATDPGSGALDVALSPEELGHLHMHVSTEGDTLRIVLTAERPDTLDLLRRHSDQLLADLRQAGFNGATLSFGQGGRGDDRAPPAATTPPPVDPARPDPARPDPATGSAYPHGTVLGNAPLDLRL